jgi:hypothetical protein
LFGGAPFSGAFAVALAILSAGSGFLMMYIYTHTLFRHVLEEMPVRRTVVSVLEGRDKVLEIVQEQLTAGEVDQDKLNVAFRSASKDFRLSTIYDKAESQRANSWWNDSVRNARTIPVFRALIDVSGNDVPHQYYGSLGFALKDLRSPKYTDAEEMLTRAIRR